ncbi:MAG: nitroreductase family deazaflavin-dependent oxidoreductase [Actinomycetota bacterium]
MGGALNDAASLDYCYLTTRGRVTGKPHTIEIWFGVENDTLYLLSGGRDGSDWVKNLIAEPAVQVRIGDGTYEATARVVEDSDEDVLARRLLLEKYSPRNSGLDGWGKSSLPIALDLQRKS